MALPPVELNLECLVCGQDIVLEYRPDAALGSHAVNVIAWRCPVCLQPNQFGGATEIVAVRMRVPQRR